MIIMTAQMATNTSEKATPTPISQPNSNSAVKTALEAKPTTKSISTPVKRRSPVVPTNLGVRDSTKPSGKSRRDVIAKTATAVKATITKPLPGKSAKSAVSSAPEKLVAVVAKKRREMAKKLNVIRDSFTMPSVEYDRIGELKKTCLALGIAIKKSELLRAGLATLQRLSADDLKRVLSLVENIKTGRPAGKTKKRKGTQSKKI
ncbi:MAG: hypothetical protein ABIP64_17760 [Burkholderiales bacterium]